MKKTACLMLALLSFSAFSAESVKKVSEIPATEEWKGAPDTNPYTGGFLTGLGLYDGSAGFALLGHVAMTVVPEGWLEDINDRVFLEAEVGPLFVKNTSLFWYGLHLRWDFKRDADWTFYALGGLGGSIAGSSLGNSFRIFPRFGMGLVKRINDTMGLRAELSHNLIAAGLTFGF